MAYIMEQAGGLAMSSKCATDESVLKVVNYSADDGYIGHQTNFDTRTRAHLPRLERGRGRMHEHVSERVDAEMRIIVI